MPQIKIVTYGNFRHHLDLDSILRWKSKLFSIIQTVNEYNIGTRADTSTWGFSDKNLLANLPSIETIKVADNASRNFDLVIYVTNIPLENNYFSRILSGNQVVVTIHEIKEILEEAEVPIENFIISILYTYSLMYVSSGGTMNMAYEYRLAHDDANGCIFDQCGNKKEVVETCLRPHLCDLCKSHFLNNSVPTEQLNHINSELRKLDRPIFYRLKYFIKKRPILALAISAISAIILNLISGLLLELLTK